MNRKNSGNEEIEIVKEIKANRKYKDTVFRMLFSNKERLLELYNAVSGKHYDDVDGLDKNRELHAACIRRKRK